MISIEILTISDLPVMFMLLLFIIAALYCCIVLLFTVGMLQIKIKNSTLLKGELKQRPFVSIVIAVRNEEQNILPLLSSLIAQQYTPSNFEIIVCDDHSEDGTLKQLHLFKNNLTTLHTIRIVELQDGEIEGKKAAIGYAVGKAKGHYVLCTDADCQLNPLWIQSHIASFTPITKIVAGPVALNYTASLFSQMQALEFDSLMASTAGAVQLGYPFMVNGANLSFERETYLSLMHDLKHEVASGDDVFLLHAIKRKFGHKAVSYNAFKEAVVTTAPMRSITSLLTQRVRWSAKSKNYTDFVSLLVAISVFLFSSMILCYLLVPPFWSIGLLLLCLKGVVDFPLLFLYSSHVSRTELLKIYLFLWPIYPIYILVIALRSFFDGYKWKGRTYKR